MSTIVIPGYRITSQIYSGSRTHVYRGILESDQKAVVLKLLLSEYPTFTELVQFRNQYTIGKNLDLPGVVKHLSLETYRNGFFLVMEDFGGVSLSEYATSLGDGKNSPFTATGIFSEFLNIALQIVGTLEGLYQNRVIHKDIKPQNILINPQTKEVKLIDFSISSLLPRENQEIANPNMLEGTLPYISPEQTGRMNRGIDYRTDFYSLGITFYELLTGQRPFQSDDPLELIHCHIARQPNPPIFINPAIPQVANNIVMKLIAKTAEERYQTAFGLQYDLERCLAEYSNQGSIAPFNLGERDISNRFVIPEKLYGRENELKTLLAAFDRAANPPQSPLTSPLTQGGCKRVGELRRGEIMLVAGFSGIGKTAVINEVHKPIVRQRGYFIKGKFDQFKRDIPFSAWVQAFQYLMRQLLGESDSQVFQWQNKILQALGENGQVIIDVIPELEQLIGKQIPAPELEGNAAQNRFNLLFEKFIRVFATKEHPLVIFLDDLQWADSASLKLMQLLLCETDTRYLLLIGAYRDNEVFPAHPLMLTLDEIRKAGATVNQITLAPLDRTSLNCLIADTLCCPQEGAMPLTELVFAKTKGNPFFATQFLKSLHEDGLISFDFTSPTPLCPPLIRGDEKEVLSPPLLSGDEHEVLSPRLVRGDERDDERGVATGVWQCDIAQIGALALTDDVVEFMALQLQKLPEPTQDVLKLAACIGNQFDLATLAIVREQSQAETATDLWSALQEGIVIPVSDVCKLFQSESNEQSQMNQGENSALLLINDSQLAIYKFLHDRVQQAAYFLIAPDQKQSTHLRIGRLLLHNISAGEREEKIFDLVNQLNSGRELINDRSDRDELAQLNLIAGHKAKASTAYAAAKTYLTAGLELLAADSWQHQYDLTLDLYDSATEIAYLNGDFEQMDTWATVVLEQAKTMLDRVKVYEVKIQTSIAKSQLLEAIEIGLQALKLLNVTLPESPNPSDIQQALAATATNLSGKNIEELIDLPLMTDVEKLASLRILSHLFSPTYIAAPALLPIVTCEQVNLSFKYGNASFSPYAYANYSAILNGVIQDVESAYQFGNLALNLLERLNPKEFKAKTINQVAVFTLHAKVHIRETFPLMQEAYKSGVENGDLEFAGYAATQRCQYLYWSGLELPQLETEISIYSNALAQIKQEVCLTWNKMFWQVVLNLQGQAQNPCHLGGTVYDEEKILPLQLALNDRTGLYYFYTHKLVLHYLFGDCVQAAIGATQAAQYLDGVAGVFVVPVYYFYKSLSQLNLYSSVSRPEQKKLLKQVKVEREKLHKFAQDAPMNHLHKFYLVEAERYRVLGKNLEAMDNYDRAISTAKENGYIQEEALANELAAKFYLAWGKETIAQAYLTKAYYCYARWGAKAKVKDLEQRYPKLLAPILLQVTTPKPGETLFQTISSTISSNISGSGNSSVLDLTAVLKASQALSSEIDLNKLLSTLMQVVLENAGASKCALILSGADKLVIEATGISGTAPTKLLQSIPVEQSDEVPVTAINYVYRTSQTLVLDDASSNNIFASDPYIINTKPKSILCTPIVHQSKPLGILYLENNLTTRAFTQDRLEVLKILSGQAAISITNAKLYAEVTANERRLTQFFEAMPIGVAVHEPTGQLYYANQAAQKLLGINVLPEAKTEELSEAYQIYRAGTNQLYPEDQLPILRALAGESATLDDLELHQANKISSFEISATPILDETGKIVYAIAAFQDITQRKKAEKLIDEYNQTLEGQVKERTAQIAKANQEIIALNDRLKAENLRMSAELDIAQQIQQMVLPKPEECQAIADLEIAGFMEPADEVGGDYYDILYTDGIVTIGIGDVTGHGLESGILMVMTQTAVRTLKEIPEIDPVRFLDTLNRTIYKNLQRMNCDKNLTLAILNYAEGIISISGQHEEVIIVRKGGKIERINTIDLGFPIGLDDDIADFIGHELVELAPGDGVVLYTDGIPEARNIDRKFYGLERLCEVVAINWHLNAQEIKQAAIDDLRGFIGEQKVFDDITLVVFKRTDE